MPDGMAKFDVTGQQSRVDGTASVQWATRPDDQRFVSLDDLIDELQFRTERSENSILRLDDIEPVTDGGTLRLGARGMLMDPTNFSFGQYCQRLGIPGGFISKNLSDDPDLASLVLQKCIANSDQRDKEVGMFHGWNRDGSHSLRAVNGKDYGRIWDLEIAKAVRDATQEGGAKWSVPTAFRTADGKGGFGQGNIACEDPTKQSTTLYASDRDIFLFMVDERNPIEAGKLPNGDPDLYYRGFYLWNGENGDTTAGISSFLYRFVCMNRNIWGQKEFQSIKIIHRQNAGQRLRTELIPALKEFVNGSATGIADGLEQVKRAKLQDPMRWFDRFGFNPKEAAAICQKSIDEEGRPVGTVFDAVQAMTAWARQFSNQDRRVEIESKTQKMMDLVLA